MLFRSGRHDLAGDEAVAAGPRIDDELLAEIGRQDVRHRPYRNVDDAARRVAWSAKSERLSHHNASSQVFASDNGTKVVWIADLLPNEMKAPVAGMIDMGLAAMQKALGRK